MCQFRQLKSEAEARERWCQLPKCTPSVNRLCLWPPLAPPASHHAPVLTSMRRPPAHASSSWSSAWVERERTSVRSCTWLTHPDGFSQRHPLPHSSNKARARQPRPNLSFHAKDGPTSLPHLLFIHQTGKHSGEEQLSQPDEEEWAQEGREVQTQDGGALQRVVAGPGWERALTGLFWISTQS